MTLSPELIQTVWESRSRSTRWELGIGLFVERAKRGMRRRWKPGKDPLCTRWRSSGRQSTALSPSQWTVDHPQRSLPPESLVNKNQPVYSFLALDSMTWRAYVTMRG